MKRKKLLLCVFLLACTSAGIAYAEDSPLIIRNDKEIKLETIAEQTQEENSVFLDLYRNNEVKTESLQNTETPALAEEPSPVVNNEFLANQENITPVYDLKGGVEKTPDAEVEKEPETQKESFLGSWWNGDYATGNWFGLRKKMMDHGITIDSSFLQSSFGKSHGGMYDARAVRGYGLFNLSATLDTEKMGLWKGGTGFVLYQLKKGMGLSSTYMGDIQVIDGYDFREMNQISEVWYQQKLFDGKVRLKVGKQDALTDISSLVKGFDFLNTSFSMIPTVPVPTYPDQRFGFMAEVSPKPWLSLRNGIYHKEGGAFNITEVELKSNIKGNPGRYIAGYWAQSANTEIIAGIDTMGNAIQRTYFKNYGGYAAFEQMVYKENKKDKDNDQGLTLIGQIGITPSNRNDLNRYYGVGLHYKGLIPKRDKDIMGVGMAMANFSTRLADIDGRSGQETAVECFYRVQVNPWLYFQPDLQFIANPGGNAPNSIALGLRSVIKF